jgi:hypothetical protein
MSSFMLMRMLSPASIRNGEDRFNFAVWLHRKRRRQGRCGAPNAAARAGSGSGALGIRQAPTRNGSAAVEGRRRSRNSATPSRPAALDSQAAASSRDANSSAHMRGTSFPLIGTTTRQQRPTCRT